MKKIICILMAVCLAFSFRSCKGEEEPRRDVNEVLEAVNRVCPVAASRSVDDEYMSDVLGIPREDYEEYAGLYSQLNISSDIILVVKASEGKARDLQKALEERRDNLAERAYLPSVIDKANGGRVVTKGDYVILAVAGDMDVLETEGVEKMYEPIDRAIEEAFK